MGGSNSKEFLVKFFVSPKYSTIFFLETFSLKVFKFEVTHVLVRISQHYQWHMSYVTSFAHLEVKYVNKVGTKLLKFVETE